MSTFCSQFIIFTLSLIVLVFTNFPVSSGQDSNLNPVLCPPPPPPTSTTFPPPPPPPSQPTPTFYPPPPPGLEYNPPSFGDYQPPSGDFSYNPPPWYSMIAPPPPCPIWPYLPYYSKSCACSSGSASSTKVASSMTCVSGSILLILVNYLLNA